MTSQASEETELTKLRKENEFLRTCSVVDLSIRNPNVKSWMHEMEGRVNEARGQAEARKILLEQVRRDTLNEVLASVKKHSDTARTKLAKTGHFCIDQEIWSAIVSHLDIVSDSVAKMRGSGPTLPETASSWPVPAVKPGPVAEVTRREVVSGKYGRLDISKGLLTAPREVGIRLIGESGWVTDVTVLTATEVREMRDVLDAILPVLEAE